MGTEAVRRLRVVINGRPFTRATRQPFTHAVAVYTGRGRGAGAWRVRSWHGSACRAAQAAVEWLNGPGALAARALPAGAVVNLGRPEWQGPRRKRRWGWRDVI